MSPLVFLYADIFICACLIVIGLMVYLKNRKLALHRLLFIFTIATSAWILLNFYSNYTKLDHDTALLANHLVFLFPMLAAGILVLFVSELTGQVIRRKRRILLYAVTGLLSVAAMTPLIVTDVEPQGEVFAVHFGLLSPLYFAWVVTLVTAIFVLLSRAIKTADDRTRRQLKALQRALASGFIIVLTMNFVMPVFVGAFQLTQIGIFGTLFLVGALLYSMAKHQLFDIRFVVVRALGYVLAMGTLVLVYSAFIFLLTEIFLAPRLSDSERVLISASVAVAGLLFGPIKRFFDSQTNRIFYRDSYNVQEVFDKLNKLLVSSLDLGVLMRGTTAIIQQYLKPEFTAILLNGDKQGARVYGTVKKQLTKHDMALIEQLVPKVRQSVIAADYLDKQFAELQEVMRTNDIAVFVRLTRFPNKSDAGQGYIMLGYRKSGNAYADKDVQTLEAIANELVLAIQNALHFEEIQNFNMTLRQQIDDATRKLRRTNEKLKQLDEAKDDFVSMASHQLRTPLTSIKGYISMVIEGDAGPINDLQKKLLEQSFFSSQRMVFLIADLLNVSRLKTGKFIIEPGDVNLIELIQQEVAQLKDTAAGRSLRLEAELPAKIPVLELDETKTRQVVMNFIDNAIYYTPAGGHITVKLIETPTAVEFRVVDDGIGVPKSEQPHLFTKFYRAKNARKARPDGTGLGLFMAKKVVVAQGGAIIFETETGKGSTFGFMIPKKRSPLKAGEHHIDS